jgi:hypothetical protein
VGQNNKVSSSQLQEKRNQTRKKKREKSEEKPLKTQICEPYVVGG